MDGQDAGDRVVPLAGDQRGDGRVAVGADGSVEHSSTRLAAREHLSLDGWVRVSRNTLDRWVRWYREGGFDALVPAPRRQPKATPEPLLELAIAPAPRAARAHGGADPRIILEAEGHSPSARTINRHLAAAGLRWRGGQIGRALGRFEAEFRNEL